MAEAFNLKKTSRHGILDVWEVQLKDFTGELQCSLPGLEFLVPPYSANEIQQNKKCYNVDPKSVIVFGGSESHIEKFFNTTALLRSVVINQEYFSELCQPLSVNSKEIEFISREISMNAELTEKVKLLADLSVAAFNTSSFSIDCFASEFVVTILTQFKHSHTEAVTKDLNTGHFPGAMPRIKSIIHENIVNPDFNLDMLAQEAGLSKFHLIRLFKKNVGKSPANYLTQIKMDLAKHELLRSKKSILAIAMDLGFSDLSTFNKAFKKIVGVSPTTFRSRP